MIFRNATIWKQNRMVKQDAIMVDGKLHFFDSNTVTVSVGDTVFSDCLILPGFCDVHVHLREPGFSYKETMESGTAAAAHGGYTAVCSMPNLNPVPDSSEHLKIQTEAIRRNANVAVYPYGALTVGEAGEMGADLEDLASDVIGFSDDGRGVQNEELMRSLMVRAKRLEKPVVAHCEDNSLLRSGYIHDGDYAKIHGHRGICSESEWRPIERDLRLVAETGCSYHVCHVSTKESVALIRRAKSQGLPVTCETAPHYLVMSDADLQEEGRFKMNPPLRDEQDRQALVEGILDGTVDMIATDHAPHSAEEKSRGLEKSAFGVVGLETAFPVLYTRLVKTGILSIERLVELLCIRPRSRFGIASDVGYSIWNVQKAVLVDPANFLSLGRSTPFEGWKLYGENLFTVYQNRIVYRFDDAKK